MEIVNTINMKMAVSNVMVRHLINQAKGIEAHALQQVYMGINKKLHYQDPEPTAKLCWYTLHVISYLGPSLFFQIIFFVKIDKLLQHTSKQSPRMRRWWQDG